jgi:hypothetical protein
MIIVVRFVTEVDKSGILRCRRWCSQVKENFKRGEELTRNWNGKTVGRWSWKTFHPSICMKQK